MRQILRSFPHSLLRALVVLVWHGATAPVIADVQATFHVSPTGNDDSPGTEARPFASLQRARQAVRGINAHMTGDIAVVLRGGTYSIDRTLVFDAADSGSNGHFVIYRSRPGETAVVSGGTRVTGWQTDVRGRWKAKAPITDFRQLYVGGKRAVRARGPAPAAIQLFGADGYKTTPAAMADWHNPSDLEFCYQVVWCHTRCKVQGIRRDGDHAIISMLQPQFGNARVKEGVQIKLPNAIENAMELLDEPGEWYLDRPAGIVYYLPRPGEDMTKIDAIVPAIERLVELRGTLDRPVHHLRLEGLSFTHSTWLEPNQVGLIDVQANFTLNGKKPLKRQGGLTAVHNEHLKSPSAVVGRAARSVVIERCTFTQLGGAGLDLEFGAQENMVRECRFFDISGTAVQVGDVLEDDHHPKDPRMIVRANTVANNYIHDTAVEYMGGVGVFVGYTEETVVAHNEITRLPYTGVSCGWGWGEEDAGGGHPKYHQPFRYDKPTPARNNRIEQNHIHHVMIAMKDGAGVYALGNMPGTMIRGNHIHDNRGTPGGIYLDEGSGFIEVTGNLVYGVRRAYTLNNFAQNRSRTCKEHGNNFGPPSADTKTIAEQAGLEPEYQDLLKGP